VHDHLNKGRYYSDAEWVANHLADLVHQFKDVRTLVQVRFEKQADGTMSLAHQRRPERIAQAARLDGKWVLVSNQPLRPGQSEVDYMDWMLGVYKNHRHVERRMRNLKSDLPIRPIFVHRDDALVALCFVSVVALMVYTLIERDCQTNPELVAAGLRTTDLVLDALSGFCLTVFLCPSGDEYFWFDTPAAGQALMWRQLGLPDPGTRASDGHRAGLTGQAGESNRSPADLTTGNSLPPLVFPGHEVWSLAGAGCQRSPYLTVYAVVKVLIVMLC